MTEPIPSRVDQIDALLAQQRADGTLDSAGAFTMDVTRARVKLARFRLGEPGAYLLKLIQAGVLARCRKIEIWLDGQLRIRYLGIDLSRLSGSASGGALDALTRGLADPLSLPPDSAAACLASGILAGQLGKQKLEWTDTSGATLGIRDGEVELESREGVVGAEPEATLTLSGLGGCWVEHKTLTSRCGYCPVPIWVNGSRLACPWERVLNNAYWLAEQFWGEAPAGGGVGFPGVGEPVDSARCALQLTDGEAPWDCAIAVPIELTGPNVVHWVRYGVIVKSDFWSRCPCCGGCHRGSSRRASGRLLHARATQRRSLSGSSHAPGRALGDMPREHPRSSRGRAHPPSKRDS